MRDDPYESMRARYQPRHTRVLFVGESRPSGGTFFFHGDSRLAQYTCEALGTRYGPFADVPAFLARFKALGCFLIDLCPNPVNHLPKKLRRKAHRAGEIELAVQFRHLKPRAIVVVMKAIAKSVARAAVAAATDVPRFELPFPSHGHEREYVSGLRDAVQELVRTGMLDAR